MTSSEPPQADAAVESQLRQLLAAAQDGSNEALGELLGLCRAYLLTVADVELPRQLRAKIAPSDIVQQASLDVCRSLARFSGQTRHELLAWMRRILLDKVADAVREYRQAEKRDLARELPLPNSQWLAARRRKDRDAASPSQGLLRHEEQERLDRAIEQLPEDYRTVVVLHHREGLPMEAIAERMNRSVGAVRKLWARALQRLGREMEEPDESRRSKGTGPQAVP
ncbi:MAG: sigma-70 family RNA polymerase sigma factor [Thermoguttaceae bacterium]|jgi:RNA polymerase sigma-70 factor (ECF subfamily)|nr:sigma-70 family RNA polymerase sigma factor [Thermoguttaceae bacterium]